MILYKPWQQETLMQKVDKITSNINELQNYRHYCKNIYLLTLFFTADTLFFLGVTTDLSRGVALSFFFFSSVFFITIGKDFSLSAKSRKQFL